MNLNEVFNEVAMDADRHVLADPAVIREAGERLRTRSRRRTALAVAAAVALLITSVISIDRFHGNARPEPVNGIDGWQVTRTINVPSWGVMMNVDGSLWVTDAENGALNSAGTAPAGVMYEIDPATGDVVARIPGAVGGWPSVGRGAIWLSTAAGGLNVLTRVDLNTHQVTRISTAPGRPLPHGAAATRYGVWVANTDLDEVVRLNPETGAVTKRIRFGIDVNGEAPWNPIVDQGTVWVSTDDGRVVGIDAATGRQVANVKLPIREARFTWTRGHVLVVSGRGGDSFAVDVTQADQPTTEPATGFTTLQHMGNVQALTAAAGSLWMVRVGPDELLRLDPATFEITGRMPLSGIDSDSPIPAQIVSTDGAVWIRTQDKVLKLTKVE